jgi:transposase
VLSVEDWAEIRRLRRAEKMSISEIARVQGISRNTVKAAVRSDAPPKYERKPAGSIVDAVEPRIRELLQAYPTIPATVIAERIGWTRSIRVLSARVAELRPAYLPPDPAGRTAYEPGEIGQCDLWFPPIMLPVGFGVALTALAAGAVSMGQRNTSLIIEGSGCGSWVCAPGHGGHRCDLVAAAERDGGETGCA